MAAAIEFVDCSYQYSSDFWRPPRQALKHLSLQVGEGESFAFLGPNGAGKTTTIKCLLGLIHPTTGGVKLFGKPATDPDARSIVGFVAEQPYFYDNLTVGETIRHFAVLAGCESRTVEKRINRQLERLGLVERRHERLRTLSKGLTQRVALAQALIADPRLLVLDEPFSGLDPIGRKLFRDIFEEERAKGTTLFIASHILSDVEQLCERASITVAGVLRDIIDLSARQQTTSSYELVVQGDRAAILHYVPEPAVLSVRDNLVRITLESEQEAQRVLREVVVHGFQVMNFERRYRSLEEMFVELVRQGGPPP